MTSSASIGCFYLDSCVILSEILKENVSRIEKLKNDSNFHKIPCYFSDSVKQESYKKVKHTTDFLGTIVRDTMQYSLMDSRKKRKIPTNDPITSDDIKVLEELFSYYHNAVRTTRKPLPSPIAHIEDWAILYLGRKLDQKTAITIQQFLIELVKKLLMLTSRIEYMYDELVTFQRSFAALGVSAPDPDALIKLKKLGIHNPDHIHIATAVDHQDNNNEKTVFATLDFSSILNKRHLIRKKVKIECSDPLYALHHLV